TLLADTPAVDRDLVLHAQLKIDVARVLGLAPGAEIHPRRGLMELGMDSLMAVDLGNRLQHRLGRAVSPTVVFEHPTIEELARHLLALLGLDGPGGSSATVVPHADLTDEAVERALLSELEQSGY